MANDTHAQSARVRWARLRFQILGTLMAAPADDGELKARIEALAARAWRHPTTGESIRFSFKTIERWWYIARGAQDPFAALARKVHAHAGTHPSVSPALAEAIARQHRDHPRWTWQLHHDNLVALAREDPSAYRTLLQLRLRVARWDLSSVDLVDPRSGDPLATLLPLDKARNAERVRRVVAPAAPDEPSLPVGIAPHLRALMADYAATGLPPAYLPKDDTTDDTPEDS